MYVVTNKSKFLTNSFFFCTHHSLRLRAHRKFKSAPQGKVCHRLQLAVFDYYRRCRVIAHALATLPQMQLYLQMGEFQFHTLQLVTLIEHLCTKMILLRILPSHFCQVCNKATITQKDNSSHVILCYMQTQNILAFFPTQRNV